MTTKPKEGQVLTLEEHKKVLGEGEAQGDMPCRYHSQLVVRLTNSLRELIADQEAREKQPVVEIYLVAGDEVNYWDVSFPEGVGNPHGNTEGLEGTYQRIEPEGGEG